MKLDHIGQSAKAPTEKHAGPYDTTQRSPSHYAGIGASAGGLEAIEDFD
jgi:hypothetical protein